MSNILGNETWIPDERTLVCRDCGETQTYSNKYSYRRAMGLSNKDQSKQSNNGLCGKCRYKSENRKEYDLSTYQTPEYKKALSLRTLNQHYKTNCSSHEELYKHPNYINKNTKNYKRYEKAVRKMSRTQLKIHRPDLFKLLENNKWDGTDMNQLTIDHIKEVRWCFDNGMSRGECADISNLQVITMQENIDKHQRLFDNEV